MVPLDYKENTAGMIHIQWFASLGEYIIQISSNTSQYQNESHFLIVSYVKAKSKSKCAYV